MPSFLVPQFFCVMKCHAGDEKIVAFHHGLLHSACPQLRGICVLVLAVSMPQSHLGRNWPNPARRQRRLHNRPKAYFCVREFNRSEQFSQVQREAGSDLRCRFRPPQSLFYPSANNRNRSGAWPAFSHIVIG